MKKREDFTKIPKDLFSLFIRLCLCNFLVAVVIDSMAFMLQLSNNKMMEGEIILSLVFIGLYFSKDSIYKYTQIYTFRLDDRMNHQLQATLENRATTLLLKTVGKVSHRNELQGFEQKMSEPVIWETCYKFLENTWHRKVYVAQRALDVLSIGIMFTGMIKASSSEIERTGIFVFLLILSIIVKFLFSKARTKVRDSYRIPRKNAYNVKNEAKHCVLTCGRPISDDHVTYLQESVAKGNEDYHNLIENGNKSANVLRAHDNMVLTVFTLIILFIKVFEVGVENANHEILLSSIALAQIYTQFTNRVMSMIDIFENYHNIVNDATAYQKDFDTIVEVYEKELQKGKNVKLRGITVNPFDAVVYPTEDSQPFRLVSSNTIHIKRGDFVMFTGGTGTGKSTQIRLFTRDIEAKGVDVQFEADSEEIPNFVLHQDKLSLGFQSVLKELTFGKKDYNKELLIEILRAFHLYDEIAERSPDVLGYLDSTGIDRYSSGQVQRLALVRTLLNVDESTPIICFDEATNNQNDEIALQVLQYIKERYRNSVVLFATHQAVVGNVATKHLHSSYVSEGGYSLITEI